MAKGFGGGHFGTQHFGETEGMPQSLADIETVYAPRPLIILMIGAVTAYYSTETMLVAAGGEYGEDYGGDYGG